MGNDLSVLQTPGKLKQTSPSTFAALSASTAKSIYLISTLWTFNCTFSLNKMNSFLSEQMWIWRKQQTSLKAKMARRFIIKLSDSSHLLVKGFNEAEQHWWVDLRARIANNPSKLQGWKPWSRPMNARYKGCCCYLHLSCRCHREKPMLILNWLAMKLHCNTKFSVILSKSVYIMLSSEIPP